MSIPYTYTVTEANEQGIVLRYESPGRQPLSIGAHTPKAGESLEAVAKLYAPVPYWLDQEATRVVPALGTSGAFEPPQPEPVTLASTKANKLAELADWRWRLETAGLRIGGSSIRTDRESQALITGAYISLKDGLVPSVDWKAEGGSWVTLTLAEVAPIAQAVTQHVQACFSAEKALAAQIEACTTIEAVQAIVFG